MYVTDVQFPFLVQRVQDWTGLDWSWIFFLDRRQSVHADFDKLCTRGEGHARGCLADRKMPCMRAPAITVGRINSTAAAQRSDGGWAGHVGGGCASPKPTATTYRKH